MLTTRREFLEGTLGASTLLAFGAAVPGFLDRTAWAAAQSRRQLNTVLVVLQLSGGNDGLNTVVPYQDDAYHRSRPTLRLKAEHVLSLAPGLGLHPEMAAFLRLYREGYLSIIQGVGYPNSNRDHEEAMRDWHTARPAELRGLERRPQARRDAGGVNSAGPEAGAPIREVRPAREVEGRNRDTDEIVQTGWVGQAINAVYETNARTDLPGAFVGQIKAPFGLQTERAVVPSIRSLDQWMAPARTGTGKDAALEASLARLAQPSRAGARNPLLEFARQVTLGACAASERLGAVVRTGGGSYPQFPLAQTLNTVAQLIRAELGIRVYFAELGGGAIGGFDTHAGQAANHGALLRELSESVAAFLGDLRRDGLLDSVLLMTFSEFGRTLAENGRRGTGHGAAAPLFLAGGGLEGRIVGAHPSLTQLDGDAPQFYTDFRRVYVTVLDQWLGLDSGAILGKQFQPLERVVKRKG